MSTKRRRVRYPIRYKAVTMIAVLALVIIEISVAYFSLITSRTNRDTYKKIAKDISASVAINIDVDDVKYLKNEIVTRVDASTTKPLAEECTQEELDTYYVQFQDIEADPTFVKTLAYLNNFIKTNEDFLDCVYIQFPHTSGEEQFVVYITDTDTTETRCKPGYLDPIHEESKNMIVSPKDGVESHVIKTDRYGYLMIAGSPILDGDDVIAFVMVDIQMALIRKEQARSIVLLFVYLLITLIVLGAIGVLWVSLWMIRPLKKLTNAAKEYDSGNPKETHEKIQSLEIDTNDELSDLSDSLKTMENDVYERFNKVLEINHELVASREETKKMQMLANQDGLTGVRNKISYNSEVGRINKQIKDGEKTNFAIVMVDLNYLKDTNDSFGHDMGDVALIKLASFICDVFSLSPVYRVGGDEFVVICRGKDYQKLSSNVEELKRKIAKSRKSEDVHNGDNISAAVGCASFDPKIDKDVEDVFKRADQAMYENKRQLKKEQ